MSSPTAAASTPSPVIVPSVLHRTDADVEQSLPYAAAIHLNGQAFIAASEGLATIPNYAAIVDHFTVKSRESDALTQVRGSTLFKPAQLLDALGCKVVSVRPSNADIGLPTVPALILLNHRETGFPTAIIEATYLTAMRTAAGSAAATDCAARKDAKRLVVFGAGAQAKEHIHAILAVRPNVQLIHIVNRNVERADALAQELKKRYANVHFQTHALNARASGDEVAVAALRQALAAADIICTTTNSSTPLLSLSDVSPGCHINAIGSYLPDQQELSSDLVAAARIAVDSPVETISHVGDIRIPIEENKLTRDALTHVGQYLPRHQYGSKIPLTVSTGATVQLGFDLPKNSSSQDAKWRRDDRSDIFGCNVRERPRSMR